MCYMSSFWKALWGNKDENDGMSFRSVKQKSRWKFKIYDETWICIWKLPRFSVLPMEFTSTVQEQTLCMAASQNGASTHHGFSSNSRQFLVKWSLHKDDYEREENNAFHKPQYLMVKELVLPGCKKSQAT